MASNYSKIPPHMMESIERYVEKGVPLGGFLTAVFANDLSKAILRADIYNYENLVTYVQFIHWELPSKCHGSYESILEWQNERQNENKESEMIKCVTFQDLLEEQKKLFNQDSAEYHRALMIAIIRDISLLDNDKLFEVVLDDFQYLITQYKKFGEI